MFAAAHPAPELVKLRQAKAFRPLDQHNGGVGYVDAHLDHGGGHQDIQVAVAEAAQDPVLVPSSASGRGAGRP